jgi:4-cresol dehydrogenase (hydroxylating)
VMEAAFQVLSGIPSEVPLRLAYWRSGKMPPVAQPLDPARDGCGLLWYAPLVPMLPDRVRAYSRIVGTVCRAHGLEPVITFTSVADGCFVSTVPLLFDQSNKGMLERVGACYEALVAGGKKEGCFPYRGGVSQMNLLIEPERTFWKLAGRLKAAIDPDHIIATGRYCPTDDITENKRKGTCK